MYGGYTGSYNTFGNQQYAPAANATNTYLPAQQQTQGYYTGVNPYAPAYGYGGVNAPFPPPPPPPPAAAEYAAQFRTFPSQAAKLVPPTAAKNYNGSTYDAAVYSYAQQTNQNFKGATQQKNWKQGGGSGAGRHGRQSSGDNKQYYCEVCKISCAGGITYKEHLEGQRHKKKEIQAKQGVPSTSLAKNKLSYRCDLCDVTCTGADTYSAHIRGGKHLKTVQLHKKLGKHVPEDVPTIIAPGIDGPTETKAKPKWHQQKVAGGKRVVGINTVNFVGGTKLNTTGQIEDKKREVAAAVSSAGKASIEVEDEKLRAMMAAEEVQPVGEEHVTEERDATGKLVQFHCKLCDCKFSDPNAKEIHVKGRRHRLSYRQKIDPTLVVDMKPSNKRSQDKHKKSSIVPSTLSEPNMVKAPWFTQATPEGREFNIVDERTVEEKYKTLNPGIEFCKNLDRLITDINDALKIVSDKVEREIRGIADGEDLPADEPRTILGCARVGTISKNTYIKGDALAELVLSCSPIPTVELVEQIKRIFPETTTNLAIESDSSSPSCLLVTANYFSDMKCRILTTSTSVRTDDDEVLSKCADKNMCLYALASIRNSKWYDSHCQYLNSCQHVIRLFRDLRKRYLELSPIEDYKLELMVSDILDSSPLPLSPADAFKRVLEALSGGYLYSAVLSDPCETTKPNVLDALTETQKFALTELTQILCRKVAFNQLHEVLGIERVLQEEVAIPEDASYSLKRQYDSTAENGDQCGGEEVDNVENGEPEIKREKHDDEDKGKSEQEVIVNA